MDVKQVKKERFTIENKILRIIKEFEKETNTVIDDINLITVEETPMGEMPKRLLIDVKVGVKL